MATVDEKSIYHGMSGAVGNLVFRQVNGRTTVYAKPLSPRRGKLTPHQKKSRRNFIEASKTAVMLLKDAETKRLYETGITTKKRSAYTVAMADYRQPPVIEEVNTAPYDGTVGRFIRIVATDNFKVFSVHVSIRTPKGGVVEEGKAKLITGDLWAYKSQLNNPAYRISIVTVTARDVAGNTVEKQVKMALTSTVNPSLLLPQEK